MKSAVIPKFLASVLAAPFLTACGSGDGAGDGSGGNPPAVLAPTLASIQDHVFTPTCAKAGCHSGATPRAGMNLEAGNSAASLINVASTGDPTKTRVIPSNPDGSLLIMKLEGTQTVGLRMPRDGPPYLSQETIDVIRQWIADGAMP